MKLPLLGAVALLSLANGADHNSKGVATLWGVGRCYGCAAGAGSFCGGSIT